MKERAEYKGAEIKEKMTILPNMTTGSERGLFSERHTSNTLIQGINLPYHIPEQRNQSACRETVAFSLKDV